MRNTETQNSNPTSQILHVILFEDNILYGDGDGVMI